MLFKPSIDNLPDKLRRCDPQRLCKHGNFREGLPIQTQMYAGIAF